MQKYQDDLQWAMDLLDSLGFAIDQQDKSSAKVLDKFDVAKHAAGVGSFECFQPRDNEPFKNLNYTAPVTVAEAGTELEVLIGMFTSSDAAPLASAERWSQAATRLEATAHTLHSISGDLARNNKGRAFDEVRHALEDFVKRGHNISANAALMAQSAGQFPVVRAANLTYLQGLLSTNALAGTGPGVVAARKAAVATFVSTHLQPSLELLKPPVHNFGVPVVGHNGGGGVNITSFNTTGPAEAFQGINGNVAPATANNVQELGAQTADAVTDAGRGNAAANAPAAGNTSPAAGEHIPASQQHVAPAGANPAAPAGPGVAPAGTQLAANTPAHTAGMPGGAPSNAAAPGLALPGTNQRGANGSPSARGAQPARPTLPTTGANRPTAGHAPVPRAGSAAHGTSAHSALRNAPGLGGAETTGERTGSRNHGYGTHATTGQGRTPRTTVVRPELPAAHPENLRNGAAGRGLHGVGAPGTPNTAPHTGMHGTSHGSPTTGTPHAEQGAAAQNNQRGRGFYGGMAPGARGGATKGRQVKPGAGQWANSVSEYFKRQFLGAKPRTTKKVISR
ncbi:hypothetical protein [Corynebacterium sp. HMSC22B11]|uniref:hypothetical protein n=1 Tax=Corynebacterium sp. HMSC22B11 TaxID=1581056 RepID=UPI001FEEF702|nr:hypothetical protein [Corynebacterium sp. HMSC22B11]